MVVKKELYAFKFGSPVSVYKYTDFISTDHLVKTTLSTLPHNEYLRYFSVCYWAAEGSIVLTGGENEKGDVHSAKTYLMAL